jgi:hypothetical protein
VQGKEGGTNCIAVEYSNLIPKPMPDCPIHELLTASKVLTPLSQLNSPTGTTRQCMTPGELKQLHSNRRPWDAWEKRSLKRQVRENMCQRSSKSNGNSRGPEIMKALETLRTRSYS